MCASSADLPAWSLCPQVFPTVKGSLSEKQLLDLQTALSASTLEGEPINNRANNRVTQPRNDRLVFASGGVSRRMF